MQNIITVNNETLNRKSSIKDFIAALPKKYNETDLFKVGSTDVYFTFYTAKNNDKGFKFYDPIYVEGELLRHRIFNIQPNGKTKDTTKRINLELPVVEVVEESNYEPKAKKEAKGRKPLNIIPKNKSEVKSIKKGSKQEIVARMLFKGATMDELTKAVSLGVNTVRSGFHTNMRHRKGYGVKQVENKFFLVLPDGLNEIIVN